MSEKTKEIELSKSSGHKILPDQRARSLDMKYYLVTGGLSSVHQPCNNIYYIYCQILARQAEIPQKTRKNVSRYFSLFFQDHMLTKYQVY